MYILHYPCGSAARCPGFAHFSFGASACPAFSRRLSRSLTLVWVGMISPLRRGCCREIPPPGPRLARGNNNNDDNNNNNNSFCSCSCSRCRCYCCCCRCSCCCCCCCRCCCCCCCCSWCCCRPCTFWACWPAVGRQPLKSGQQALWTGKAPGRRPLALAIRLPAPTADLCSAPEKPRNLRCFWLFDKNNRKPTFRPKMAPT